MLACDAFMPVFCHGVLARASSRRYAASVQFSVDVAMVQHRLRAIHAHAHEAA
jgi:hypothetical protein